MQAVCSGLGRPLFCWAGAVSAGPDLTIMLDKELETLVVPEVTSLGFECIKVEVVGSRRNPIVRIFIDKPVGVVDLADCSLVSRSIALLLEEKDPFPGRYLLEVSSPGSNRPLTTEAHFQKFVGESARVETAAPEASRITYTGHIRSCINGLLTLGTPEGEVAIELSAIVKASLVDREYKIDKKMKHERRTRRLRERKGDRT